MPTTEAAYRRMLAPVVRHAKKLVLIDRYLTPHKDRFLCTVKLCMDLLREDPRGPRAVPIHIHAGDPTNPVKDHNPEAPHERLAKWATKLGAFISERRAYRFEVSLWQDPLVRQKGRSAGQKFHDRYFLTDQCAVGAQSGLDCSWDDKNLTTWSLLDDKERLRVADLVTPATSPWTRLGHKVIPETARPAGAVPP